MEKRETALGANAEMEGAISSSFTRALPTSISTTRPIFFVAPARREGHSGWHSAKGFVIVSVKDDGVS